ncbi:MAG: rhodanese-like domain-containing protein [Rickettsiales bacterium]|nr:rhodanese-like domain-containing protein [Rickettsiales bacterium]
MSQVNQITPNAAFELLKNDSQSAIIDVRTFEEFASIGIIAADQFDNRMILLPWQLAPEMKINQEFDKNLDLETKKLFGSKNQEAKIIFICRSGARSTQAALKAQANGYKNCYNLINGFEGDADEFSQRGKINGWKAQSLPWRMK